MGATKRLFLRWMPENSMGREMGATGEKFYFRQPRAVREIAARNKGLPSEKGLRCTTVDGLETPVFQPFQGTLNGLKRGIPEKRRHASGRDQRRLAAMKPVISSSSCSS
jgi:hypothetical protein